MKPEIKTAVYGGIAGTIVMTPMMIWIAPILTGFPMDIAALVGDMMGGSYIIGMIVHLMLGVIIFPAVYVYVLYERLPGSPLVKGLIYGVGLWVVAAVMIMPIAGAGFLMSEIGGMMALVAALMGHLVYGGLLGVIAGEGTAVSTA